MRVEEVGEKIRSQSFYLQAYWFDYMLLQVR